MRDRTQTEAEAGTVWKASSFTGLVLGLGRGAQLKMRAQAGCQHMDGDPPPPSRCGHSMFLSIGQAGDLCFPQVADVLEWGQKIVLEVVWHHL